MAKNGFAGGVTQILGGVVAVGLLSGCGGGSAAQTPGIPKTTVVMTASHYTTYRGVWVWLQWVSQNAVTVSNSDFHAGNVSGYLYVYPQASRTYTVTVNGPAGPATSTVAIKVAPGPSHVIELNPMCMDTTGATFQVTGSAYGIKVGSVTYQQIGGVELMCTGSPDPDYPTEGFNFSFSTDLLGLSGEIVLRVREAGTHKVLYQTTVNATTPSTINYNDHTFQVSPVMCPTAPVLNGTAVGPTARTCFWHNDSTGSETPAEVTAIRGGIRFQYKPAEADLASLNYSLFFKDASGREVASLPVGLNSTGSISWARRPQPPMALPKGNTP